MLAPAPRLGHRTHAHDPDDSSRRRTSSAGERGEKEVEGENDAGRRRRYESRRVDLYADEDEDRDFGLLREDDRPGYFDYDCWPIDRQSWGRLSCGVWVRRAQETGGGAEGPDVNEDGPSPQDRRSRGGSSAGTTVQR